MKNTQKIKKLISKNNNSNNKSKENKEQNYSKLTIKKYQNGNAGQSSVNLLDGTFFHEFNLCTIKENALELVINQVFDMKLFNEVSLENHDKFMGKGWKSNFHQRLIKSTSYNEETNSLNTTYIDGQGNYHIFEEKWYYEKDGTKHYIDKSEVYLDDNQKLKYNNFEVQYEEGKCDDLTLISLENTYHYAKKFAPSKQTRYYILLNNGTYKKYIFVDDNNILHLPNYFYCPRINEEDFDFSQKKFIKYNDIVVNENEELKYNEQYVFNVEDIEISLTSLEKISNNKLVFDKKSDELESEQIQDYIYIEETYSENKNVDNNNYLNEDIENLNTQIYQTKQQIAQLKDYMENYKQQIKGYLSNQSCQNYSLEFKEQSKISRNSMEHLEEVEENLKISNPDTGEDVYLDPTSTNKYHYYLQSDKYDTIQTLSSLSSLNNQRDKCVEEYYKLVDQFNEYSDLKNSLLSYKNRLVNEQMKEVNAIILDTNKNILGFDGYGRLVLVQDFYENTIVVEYEHDIVNDKIISIHSDSQKIIFEYNKNTNLLERIVTPKGTIIKYTYNLENLSEVSNNNQIIQFNYFESLNKLDIYDSLRNRLIIQFEDFVQQVIFEKSNKIVEANGSLSESGKSQTLLHHIYQFNQSKTLIKNMSVSDDKSASLDEIYYFDENKNLITYKDKNQNIVYNHFYGKKQLEYQCLMKSKYSSFKEKSVTLNQELEFSVGNGTNFDIDNSLLEKTKVIGVLLERTSLENTSINLSIMAENNTTNKVKSYSFNNTTLPWIIVPFIIPFKDMNTMTISISTDSTTTENVIIKIVRLSSTFYTYDESERLTFEENGYNSISYGEFINDKPTLITETDEFGRQKNTVINYDYNGNIVFIKNHFGVCERYFYNEKNQLIEKITYPNDEPTLVNIEKYQYDEKGNPLYNEDILPNTSLVRKNESLTYGYDYHCDRLKEMACVANGVVNKTQYKYNYDFLTKLTHDKMTYEYTYDSLGRIQSIKIANTEKSLYLFTYNDNLIHYQGDKKYDEAYEIIITDAANHSIKTTYDKDGRILELDDSDSILNYIYDEDNQLVFIKENNLTTLKTYTYNQNNQIVLKQDGDTLSTYRYDDFNRLSKEYLSFKNNISSNINYEYVSSFNDLLKSVNIDYKVKVSHDFNSLQQVTKESVAVNNTSLLSNEYYYLQKDKNITNLITQQITKINDQYDDVINCKYDENGNITSMISKQNCVYYQYDELNRLIREDNLALDTTTLIQYDARGNILFKKEKYFNLEDIDLYKAELKQSYAYSSKGFKDQLVSFNGNKITYDECGRVVSYNGKTFNWNNDGTLKEYDENQYFYNRFKIRTGKKTNIGIYNFIVSDSKILMMELNDEEIFTFRYFVDKVIGFCYNGNEYIYKRDILGNITHIIDSSGKVVAQYIYDAWGNHKVLDENGQESINEKSLCNLNPFRYKGYFYDVETGFYYCNTRYYNPQWSRWLTPDSIEYLEPTSINGLNLYAYCGNNPIMYYDPTGHSLLVALLILTAIFVTAGGIYGGVSAAMTGNNIWEGIGKGMLVGGVFSAALALTIGGFAYGWTTVLGSIMITYGASVMANMVEVSGTQWHKSTYDGDNSWNKANDITNASFANLGRVLVGSSFVPDILILGTKVTSKIPLVSKFFDNVNVLKQSYSTSTAYSMTWNNFWSSKASFGSLVLGYGLSIVQMGKAIYSIFGQPDIENSRWILY